MKYFLYAPYWIRFLVINVYGFFLYKKRFNKNYKTFKDYIDKNLLKTNEAVLAEQFDHLRDNLIYCYQKIPYYKNLFNEVGFDPYTFSSLEDIRSIPYLTKDIIRQNFDLLYNKDIPKSKYLKHYTSGSTGEKLEFLIPKTLKNSKNTAFLYRFYSFLGIREKDKRVTIGGRRFTNKAPFWVYNFFEKQLLLSSHHLNDDNIEKYVIKLNSFKPVFIQGHPSSILVLAKYIKDRKVALEFNLKGIFTTGETLTEPDRKIIESAFKTIVLQQYGSGENVFSAQESPSKEGYLLNYEHGFVELVGKGELKEVVVTSLLNDVMPFVRYKIGDYASATDFKMINGFSLPVKFDQVIGRVDDIIFNTSGKSIIPVTVRMLFKPYLNEGANYQLVQIDSTHFELNLVGDFQKFIIDDIITELLNLLGDGVEIKVIFKKSLMTKGGKIRNVVNNSKDQ